MAVRAMDRGGGEGGERRGRALGGREEDWARLARESKESGGARDGVGDSESFEHVKTRPTLGRVFTNPL